jgi:hypothetical protein
VRSTDFTFGQGVVVDLCSVGGGLFGLGIGAFAAGDTDVQRRLLWSLGALGTTGGYVIGYALGVKSARKAATDRSAYRLEILPLPPVARGGPPGVKVLLSTAFQ